MDKKQTPRGRVTTTTTTKREVPKPKKKKRITKKRVFWTMFFTVAFAIFCALGGYLYITIAGQKLLANNEDKLTVHENSKVYDRNGKLMGELSIQQSDPVDGDEIPKLLKDAFVATEDKRFYEHSGVDIWSIGRAAVKDVIARSAVEGGSTITQQLAKNVFLTRDKTFFRKATEVSIAMALERDKTKDEIITLYLNRINFGGQIYGIKAASEYYFGKSDLNKLEVWQMATLAAMPKGPTKYNPLRNPDLSMQRRSVVLQLMEEQGYITSKERNVAKTVVYDYTPPAKKQKYLAFMDYVMSEAENVSGLSQDDLNIGGYKIYTTMDANAQLVVEKEFADASNFEESVDDQQVQGSMMIMNNDNGAVIALLGGRDYERKGYSRVTDSRRQPGSSLKPIVSYAPALESGSVTIDTPLSNREQCFANYCPRNLHGYSNTISMADAIQKSENIPAVWLLNEIGVSTGFKFAQKLGINMEDEDKNLSLALGGMSTGTNTLEMTQAYSAFANGGVLNPAYSIKSIIDSDEKAVYEHKDKGTQVMSDNTAYQMTQMLQNVVNSGTGTKAKINRPVAGKTGTTQSGITGNSSNRDVWFVGYTPELTAAVWMGYDKPDKDHMLKKSSSLAAGFWGKVMEQAVQGFDAKSFPVPKEVQQAEPEQEPVTEPEPVASVSGLIASYNPETQIVSLSWNASQEENVQYRVYRKESSEGSYSVITDSATSSEAEDFNALEGLTYEYYVTAIQPDSGVESEQSNTVQVMIEVTDIFEDPIDETEPIEPPIDENNGNGNGSGNGNIDNGNHNGNGNGNKGNGNNNGNGNGNGNGSDSGSGDGVEVTPPGGDTGSDTGAEVTPPDNTQTEPETPTDGISVDGSQQGTPDGGADSGTVNP
ncbi:penicillin-binding protein 2A [Paenibacillus sp. DS2015]|uniref:transglycosylase domain-containing protein n=1 Tax=Paenibacillus sp. DS2015 TaxID=3373917 RepID=UPI003D24B3D6